MYGNTVTRFCATNVPTATELDTEYVDDITCALSSHDLLLSFYFDPWKRTVNQEKTERHTIAKGINFSPSLPSESTTLYGSVNNSE